MQTCWHRADTVLTPWWPWRLGLNPGFAPAAD